MENGETPPARRTANADVVTAPSAAQNPRWSSVRGETSHATPLRPTEPPPSQNMDIVFLYPPPDASPRGSESRFRFLLKSAAAFIYPFLRSTSASLPR